jgi:hypothetical protein
MRTGWAELAAILVVLLGVYLVRSNHWLSSHARLAWNWIRAWARLAPFTATLWLLVAVHAWMLIGLPPRLRDQVLLTHSTTLKHLRTEPITVLFGSAIWTDVGELVFLTCTALIYLGPLERWIGPWRTLVAFLAGHIGATVLLAIWLGNFVDVNPTNDKILTKTIDVGVSYGVYSCAALLGYRLRMPYRVTAWAVIATYLMYQASISDFDKSLDYTAFGHVLAFAIGLACYPLTRTSRAKARRDTPWIRVWVPAGREIAPARLSDIDVLPAGDGEDSNPAASPVRGTRT